MTAMSELLLLGLICSSSRYSASRFPTELIDNFTPDSQGLPIPASFLLAPSSVCTSARGRYGLPWACREIADTPSITIFREAGTAPCRESSLFGVEKRELLTHLDAAFCLLTWNEVKFKVSIEGIGFVEVVPS